MARKLWAAVTLAVLAALMHTPPAWSQDPQGRVIPVAVRIIPPLVQQTNGRLTGFSVDLWNAIADRCHWTSAFKVVPSVQAQLAAVSGDTVDVGVGAISITAERVVDYDFSQPILTAGLEIMTRAARPSPESTALRSLMHLLLSPAVVIWLGIAALLTVGPAHIIFFIERRQPDGLVSTPNYFPGIFQAFFWGLATLATQADAMPRHWISRAIAVLWMFTGVVFVALYTATLTANLTVQQIRREINGPADLPGKTVATVGGTTSARYLRNNNIQTVAFANAEEAFHALMDDQVDAIVYDAPVLQFIAAHEGQGRVAIVAPIFEPEDYGFVFRDGSGLRRDVDRALLSMRDDGTYEQLRDRWFGKS